MLKPPPPWAHCVHFIAILGLLIFVRNTVLVAQDPSLADLHRALLAEVQGEALTVGGSPRLCEALGKARQLPRSPGRSTPQGARNPQAQQMQLQREYFGSNACVLEYPPALDAVVTKATTGLAIDVRQSAARAESIARRLDAVAAAVRADSAPPTRRLLLHSLAWEVGVPLHREARARGNPAIEKAACSAWDLLRATRLDDAEQSALPSTLGSLAEMSSSEAIADSVRSIVSGDESWLEVIPVSDSHAEALLGRFTPRIFLSAPRQADRVDIQRFLTDEGRSYHTMGRLPLLFDSLDAVLVLYFNALEPTPRDGPPRVRPTPLVAFWQQYTFSGRIDMQQPDLPQAEDKVIFRTVRFDLDLDLARPAYVEVDQNHMAHKSFVEAMPPRVGSPVTVQRGVCLRCHTKVVETFHPEAERSVSFTRPLERPANDVLAPYFRTTIEPELAEWRERCQSTSP